MHVIILLHALHWHYMHYTKLHLFHCYIQTDYGLYKHRIRRATACSCSQRRITDPDQPCHSTFGPSVNQGEIICGLFEQIISNNRLITSALFAIIWGLFEDYLRLFEDYLLDYLSDYLRLFVRLFVGYLRLFVGLFSGYSQVILVYLFIICQLFVICLLFQVVVMCLFIWDVKIAFPS